MPLPVFNDAYSLIQTWPNCKISKQENLLHRMQSPMYVDGPAAVGT